MKWRLVLHCSKELKKSILSFSKKPRVYLLHARIHSGALAKAATAWHTLAFRNYCALSFLSLRSMSAAGMTWNTSSCGQCQPPQLPGRISLGEPSSQVVEETVRESAKRRTYIDCAAGAGINSWSRQGAAVPILRAAVSKAPVLKAVEIHRKCASWITWHFCRSV